MDAHLLIVAFLYIFFSIVAIAVEMKNIQLMHRITIISMCRLMFVLSLGLIPVLLCIGQFVKPDNYGVIDFSDDAMWTFYVQFIFTVLCYCSLNFGYSIKQRTYKEYKGLGGSKVFTTSLLCVCLGAVALYLWASAFGGIDRLIKQAEWIRAGAILPTTPIAFFKHFVPLAMLSSYLLFNLLLRKEVHGLTKILTYILLAVSVVVSNVYIQASDGRLQLASYVLVFFLVYFSYQHEEKKLPFKKLLLLFIPVLVIFTIILFNAETILHSLRGTESLGETTESVGFWDRISDEFFFIIAGQQGAIEGVFSGKTKLMIVNDVVNGLFAWLPTSMTPFKLQDVWSYNTQLITPGATGTNPTTLVAQSVYDLGIIGVLVVPFFYGMLVKKMERVLDSFPDSLFAKTVYVVLGFTLCRAIPYFALYSIMLDSFYVFVGVAIYYVLRKMRFGEK